MLVMDDWCQLYDRECIDCGECEICDLDSSKRCDNCCRCIDEDIESHRSLNIKEFMDRGKDLDRFKSKGV
nr:hypothetical protein [Anaerobacterium chartisolvens]